MPSIPKHIRVFSLFTAAYFLSYFYRSANAAGQYPPQAHQAALLFTAAGSMLGLIWYLPLARQE
jgi:hypothetical protein